MEEEITITMTRTQAHHSLNALHQRWSKMDDSRRDFPHDTEEYRQMLAAQNEIEEVMAQIRDALE